MLVDGQKINYNLNSKILVTTIEKPFMSAGKKVGWEWSAPGIGLNQKICKLILDYHLNLKIFIEYYNTSYHFPFTKFHDYLKKNNYEYFKSGKTLKMIPIELLIPVKDTHLAT